jgi:hypothetical protein
MRYLLIRLSPTLGPAAVAHGTQPTPSTQPVTQKPLLTSQIEFNSTNTAQKVTPGEGSFPLPRLSPVSIILPSLHARLSQTAHRLSDWQRCVTRRINTYYTQRFFV